MPPIGFSVVKVESEPRNTGLVVGGLVSDLLQLLPSKQVDI